MRQDRDLLYAEFYIPLAMAECEWEIKMQFGNKAAQTLGLRGQIPHSRSGGAHGLSRLGREFVDVHNGLVDFFTGGGLLFAGRGDGVDLVCRGFHRTDDFLQGRAGLVGVVRGAVDLLHGFIHAVQAFGRTFLNGFDGIAHVIGGSHGLFGRRVW